MEPKRFNTGDMEDGEEKFELEAVFGEDADLVDLTDVLRAQMEEDE